MKTHTFLAAAVALPWLLLTGCTTLPASGPTASELTSEVGKAEAGFEIVDISSEVINATKLYATANFSGSFHSKRSAAGSVFQRGDQVVVTIFEASAGGLFSAPITATATPAKSVALPAQTVDADGTILVPYAGRIIAAGKTAQGVAADIVAKLEDKAIEPQVIVSLQNSSATVTVAGDATGAANVGVSARGNRILDVIAEAGGVKAAPIETKVRLSRGSTSRVVPLVTILNNPKENIYVQPGDTVYVYKDSPMFTALGAVTAQKDYLIQEESLSLAEAVARAGGLVDLQSDPGAIFLFRYEQRRVVQAIVDGKKPITDADTVPVIYRLNLRDPADYFLAQKFQVRDADLIYIANSPAVQVSKFLAILRSAASTVAVASGGAVAN